MALFKKKKKEEDEPETGMANGIGLTGSLTESKKSGLFGKKKEQREPEPLTEEETIECKKCGMPCPANMDVCEVCGNSLADPETVEAEPPHEDVPAEVPPEPEPEETPAEEPVREIPVQLEMVEEEPEAPKWKPLPDKEKKAAEKAIKRDVKDLDKQLKKKHISREEHDRRVKKLRTDHGLEPPLVKPARSRAKPVPQPAPKEEARPDIPDFKDDISMQEMERGTEVVDPSAEQALEKEVDEIAPIELLALEELVEVEPEPVPEQPAPVLESDKKVGFVASRKIFGDKKKQLEEWEESLRGEEQNVLSGRTDIENREAKLQEKAFEIQTELQILQTKKKDMTIRLQNIDKREAELNDLGAKLSQHTEAVDVREAEVAQREESISDKIAGLDAREAELSERISLLEKKEKDIISRESETREKWLEMREFDRKITARSEELDSAEEEINDRRMAQRKRDAELDDKRRELDARNRELESRSKELNSLQEQIAAREDTLIAEAEANKEASKKMEETFLKIEAQREELQTHETDLQEREERQEAWKKRLEAKESELAVKANELSSKEGAIRSSERELESRKERIKSRLMELKSLEDQTLMRKREVDEVEILLIQKENELFNREQGLNRKEAAK